EGPMANVPLVFVSSTAIDLIPERQAVLAVLQRLRLPHNSMESFGADIRRPLETCLGEVNNCDVFVIIVGHRYGTVHEPDDNSFTELEYRRALDCRKPVFAYIKSDSMPVLPEYVERTTAGVRKLRALKDEL